MPQNWWELFPEIQPSPAARPRPLPGPGESMPGAAMSQGYLGNPQIRASAIEMAPRKAGDPKAEGSHPPPDRAGEIGRAVVNSIARHNRPAQRNLTPMARRRLENEALLHDPTVRAFLDTIAFAEGANYDTMFGLHRTFNDRSTHPGNVGDRYRGSRQSGAGRYQIQRPTYRGLNRILGPLTMSDHDQDLMAVELIREGNALAPVQSGDLATAVSRLAQRRTWTSFPVLVNGRWQAGPDNQPFRSFEDISGAYNTALERARQRGQGYYGRRTGPIRD